MNANVGQFLRPDFAPSLDKGNGTFADRGPAAPCPFDALGSIAVTLPNAVRRLSFGTTRIVESVVDTIRDRSNSLIFNNRSVS